MTNLLSSDYPHGFAHGVNIQNIPIEISIGDLANVYWVDSTVGNDVTNTGTRRRPFGTIDYAIGRCTADHGDIIYVAPKHSETVIAAGGVTADVAGITIIFLGEGSDRGTITFSTAVSASMVISAANVTVINPRFVSGIDALTGPISVTGTDCKIINAEWYDAPAKAATNGVVATSAATRLCIDGYTFYASTTGTQKATHIKIADIASPILRNLDIRGDFSTAPVNITAAATNAVFENWKIKNTNATPKPGLDQHANTTFIAKNLDIRIASGTTYVSSAAKGNWDDNCLGYNTDGKGGDPIGGATAGSIEATLNTINTNVGDPSGDTLVSITAKLGDGATTVTADLGTVKTAVAKIDGATLAVSPTAGSLARFIASGGTALGTSLAASKSLVDALGSDGTTLSYGSGSVLGAIGTTFWIKKTVTSSNITFASPVDITAVSSGGELAIEQVILKTNSVGLATGTNFQLLSNNANGLANILVETIGNLGGNKTITLDNASVTKIKTVLETGKKLQVQNTVADGTGAGTVDIYVQFRRLSAGATIAAL